MPRLRAADVVRAPAGVRAQALDRDGSLVDDFRLDVTGPVVWIRNAPSPARHPDRGSSLAIADELCASDALEPDLRGRAGARVTHPRGRPLRAEPAPGPLAEAAPGARRDRWRQHRSGL